MLANTKNTIKPLTRLTIPDMTLLTVELTSAMMFLLGLVIDKNGDTLPPLMYVFSL
jgi:hypothetical protein